MKALSVQQPWSWAIFHGKDVENRTWTPRNPGLRFRGRCIIHAGARPGDLEWNRRWTDYCQMILDRFDDAEPLIPFIGDVHFGALIGTVEVADVVEAHSSKWFVGPYGLLLREPRLFPSPIPYKGSLGFFDVPDRHLPSAERA
ncbi:MAG: hypothetical protein WC026_16840 [Hyphomicrobium sp.]|uniref:hypothetical protein n=1 Tax=Hyphomicrobium sp. TaxID=82 RepID=UPI0035615E1A